MHPPSNVHFPSLREVGSNQPEQQKRFFIQMDLVVAAAYVNNGVLQFYFSSYGSTAGMHLWVYDMLMDGARK